MKKERADRTWKYTIRDIAEAAGVDMHIAQYARETGELVPDSIRSVSKWVVGRALVNKEIK